MPFPFRNVLSVAFRKPAFGIYLRQRQFVRNLQTPESLASEVFVISDPAAMRVQADPNRCEEQKRPAGVLYHAARFEIEFVEGKI